MKEPLNMMLSGYDREPIPNPLTSTEDCAMAFTNEYVPRIEDENSTFLIAARQKLRLGYLSTDKWTVDRDRLLVLVRTGRGHSVESQNTDFWTFLSGEGTYRFHTQLLDSHELDEKSLSIKRSIEFVNSPGLTEFDSIVVRQIKEALGVYKDYGVISDYDSCELTLISSSGEVL